MIKHAEGLEEELRDYKDRYSKSSMRIGKLESANAEIEVEFKEKVKRLEEVEGRATERIRSLSSELENVSMEKNKELIELKMKNKEAECAKLKVDNDLDAQKRKCKELEKENDAQKIRFIGLVKRVTNLEKEYAAINLKLEVDDEVSKKEGKIDETDGGENCTRLSILNMKEITLSRDERVRQFSAGDSVRHSLAEASGNGQAEGNTHHFVY
ncbi:hypothetical protein FRX31_015540 [Thalictrum thalictroides]|uniref:Uncharacterized protein n=1 Tax=Thalictrum thalictroides TaxID=46969 RepID=A0A7J6WD18_THATH|nr:hypothetical protein FRX31_015540 [Thalictrum thalictroides]